MTDHLWQCYLATVACETDPLVVDVGDNDDAGKSESLLGPDQAVWSSAGHLVHIES